MYSERKSVINWLNILIKVIFVIIFILLIIWLFPKVPNMTPFYSNVFRENISYMQDAAESYYTNDKLPKNVGDSVEMTLGEMIDKNIILPFVDKDGKECDTKASYVQITKNEKDYTMTVNLVCPSEKNTLKKTLGCHDYCENCGKTNEVIEYQYKQPVTKTSNVLSCPKGGTLKDGMCYIYENTTYKATETTKGGEAYCNDNDTLSGNTCTHTVTTTYAAKTGYKTTYSCDGDDKLSGSTCTKTTTVLVPVTTASTKYEPTKTLAVLGNATAKTTVVSSTDPTVTKETTYVKATATTSKKTEYKSGYYTTKPDGYSCKYDFVSKDKCSTCKTTRAYYYDCTRTRTVTTYSCSDGATAILKDGEYVCPVTTSKTTCTTGKYNSSTKKCEVTKTTYSCSKGTLNSKNQCVEEKLECKDGGSLVDNMCVIAGKTTYKTTTKTTTYAAKATTKVSNVYCDNNDKLSNNTCTHVETKTYDALKKGTTTSYSCPNGGDLKDRNCVSSKLKESYKATSTSKTTTTYTYKWSTAESLENWVKTGKTRTVEK